MAYNPNAPADDEFLADFPAEQREQHRALIEDRIVDADSVRGLVPGNTSGNVAVNNGTVCANLNADKLDGHDATYFSADGHVHAAATTSSDGFMSNTDKSKLDGVTAGAEPNQNAFANVKVGSTTIQADAKQDTLELTAGTNITLTPDATNDKVTVAAPNVLPLAGGTMTGWLSANANEFRIRNSKAEHDGVVSVVGGEGTTTGANLYLYGVSHSSQAGRFVLSATDGANTKSLRGQADGTLTWNGSNVITAAGGTMTGEITFNASGGRIKKYDDSGLIDIYSATSYQKGAYITLVGKDRDSLAGYFRIGAIDGVNSKIFEGRPDGTLTWGGNDVLTTARTGYEIIREYSTSVSLTASTGKTLASYSFPAGFWVVTATAKYTSTTAGKMYGISIVTTNNRYNYDDDSTVWVSTAATTTCLNTSTVLVLNSNTTVYVTGYSNVAATCGKVHISAIRIK